MVPSSPLLIEANVRATAGISKVELLLNQNLIEARTGSLGTDLNYRYPISAGAIDLQNLVKVLVTDANGNTGSAEAIFFKQP